MDDYPIIDNPLEWQAMIDKAPASINMRGSARFWTTVSSLLDGRHIQRDGTPEFSEIVIWLKGNVGLRLFTARDNPWIDFEFVEVETQPAPAGPEGE